MDLFNGSSSTAGTDGFLVKRPWIILFLPLTVPVDTLKRLSMNLKELALLLEKTEKIIRNCPKPSAAIKPLDKAR